MNGFVLVVLNSCGYLCRLHKDAPDRHAGVLAVDCPRTGRSSRPTVGRADCRAASTTLPPHDPCEPPLEPADLMELICILAEAATNVLRER